MRCIHHLTSTCRPLATAAGLRHSVDCLSLCNARLVQTMVVNSKFYSSLNALRHAEASAPWTLIPGFWGALRHQRPASCCRALSSSSHAPDTPELEPTCWRCTVNNVSGERAPRKPAAGLAWCLGCMLMLNFPELTFASNLSARGVEVGPDFV